MKLQNNIIVTTHVNMEAGDDDDDDDDGYDTTIAIKIIIITASTLTWLSWTTFSIGFIIIIIIIFIIFMLIINNNITLHEQMTEKFSYQWLMTSSSGSANQTGLMSGATSPSLRLISVS